MKKLFLRVVFLFSTVLFLSNCTIPKTTNPKDELALVKPDKNLVHNVLFDEASTKLNAGEEPSTAETDSLAKSIETRADFYTLLTQYHKEALFPKAYYSFEKAAESVLTNWLVYPTELDTIPSAIEFVEKVDLKEKDTTFIYYVLRYKTEEPHWAAKDGWMLGVVGPYFQDSKPYDWTTGTFSRFSKVGETSPEKEVEWAHKNVFRRSPE